MSPNGVVWGDHSGAGARQWKVINNTFEGISGNIVKTNGGDVTIGTGNHFRAATGTQEGHFFHNVEDSVYVPGDHTGLTVTHASTTGQTVDDHHDEAHTVASHSDTTATGAELETLTDTSNADALHSHAVIEGGDHDQLINVSTDDHHTEAHTVASHSDTTATGAELETLTDTSNADALHSHSAPAHTIASHSDTTATGAEVGDSH